jgi:isocitrate/isopropylmalate dehydrogenase
MSNDCERKRPSTTYRIGVLPGDGIGPELTDTAVRILKAVEAKTGTFRLDFRYEDAGANYFMQSGVNISEETVDRLKTQTDGILKGPAGLPGVRTPDGIEAGMIGGVLRPRLDAFANLRPIKLLPNVGARGNYELGQINYLVVRENTEGLYATRGSGVVTPYAASDTLMMTRHGVERIVREAFRQAERRRGAPRDGVKRVTCVDKANVLKSMAYWRSIFSEVAAEFPGIEADYIYSDAAAQALILEPERFDVLVMENFLGDILSEIGGATIGGVGLCPSGNVGHDHAYFEPIHGSAPSIAGQDKVNPVSQILSAAMLLDWLGETTASQLIETAVASAFQQQRISISRDGTPLGGTRQAEQAILDCL